MTRGHKLQAEGDQPEVTVETPITFDELLKGDAHCVLYSPPEFGRTTVLRQLEHQMLCDAMQLPFARLPVIIDFVDVKTNVSRLLAALKARLVNGSEFDFETLLKLGHACVMIDDVDFSDNRMAVIREFVNRYPKARYIFTSLKAQAIRFSAWVDPEMPVHFDFVELCAFRRRDMRELVQKLGSIGDVDGVLDRIQKDIGDINLPFTAANGTVLILILEEQSGFNPVNRSVLIEQFIDVTLKKGSIEQSQRETFDYHNKTALLAYVAGWMARSDIYIASEETIREVMKSYIDRIEVTVNLSLLMKEFLSCRLFVPRSENRISFRYRSILEYFIALHMRKDAEFKAWVLDEERYLSFGSEIQYFAGSVRDDTALADLIATRFEKLYAEVDAEFGGIDFERMANLKLPSEPGKGHSVDELAEQLSEKPLSREERDAELEGEIPKDVEERQEVFRPQIEHIAHRFLLSLVLLSGVI
jgi:hypothetical protein